MMQIPCWINPRHDDSILSVVVHAVLAFVVCAQVGVDLAAAGCIHDIAKATADIKVQIVFCNAGYIMKGFFYARCVLERRAGRGGWAGA
jgi:hypothetical protein